LKPLISKILSIWDCRNNQQCILTFLVYFRRLRKAADNTAYARSKP
jgi:hypothetical protein